MRPLEVVLFLLGVLLLVVLATLGSAWIARPAFSLESSPAVYRPGGTDTARPMKRLRWWIVHDPAGRRVGRVIAIDGTGVFTGIVRDRPLKGPR